VLKGASSFEAAVDQYLDWFAYTDGVAIAALAAFPWSEEASAALFDDLHAVAHQVSYLYRLVADVDVQPDETLNAALFAAAALDEIRLQDVRERAQADPAYHESLRAQMLSLTRARVAAFRAETEQHSSAAVRGYAAALADLADHADTLVAGVF
jgi:hypothetical protein